MAEKTEEKKQNKEYHAEEHQWSLEKLSEHYKVSLNSVEPKKSQGLSTQEAGEKLITDGKNKLTPPKQTPEIVKFLLQFINPFMILLEVAAVLCLISFILQKKAGEKDQSNLYLAIVLFVIVIATSVMAYVQERKSGKLMDSFKNMLPPKCMVIRDGAQQKIFSEDLVLGDIVVLTSGDKTPADLRIIQCQDLKVDNSSLTGESEPQSRNAEISKEENPLEAPNYAFYGTLAVDGSAVGVVIRRGDDTLLGQIAGLAQEGGGKTTLEAEVKRFVIFISALAVISGIIFFIIGIILAVKKGTSGEQRQHDIIVSLVNTIGIIVANVPEGLPATVTICLTIAARRLSKNNVWVKELESVETLGSTTMICSDKTGTLTQNRMTAVHAWFDDEIHDVKVVIGQDNSKNPLNLNDPTAARLFRTAAVCCRAQFETITVNVAGAPKPLLERDIIGDASETALLRMCESYFDTIPIRDHFSKIFEIPFNSTNKFQLSIHALPDAPPPVVEREYLRPSVMINPFNSAFRNGSQPAVELEVQVASTEAWDQPRGFGSSPANSFQLMQTEAERVRSRKNNRIQQFSLDYQRGEQQKMVENFKTARTAPQRLVALKGAPEIVLGMCNKIMIKGKPVELDNQWKEKFQNTITTLASGGERILGFAHVEVEDPMDPSEYNIDKKNYPLSGYTFLGLFSLMDPPRPSVPESVATCHSAGIKVAMVTGDHPLTAKAIAKQIGLLTKPTRDEIAALRGVPIDQVDETESESVVVTGMQLREYTEEDWAKIINKKEFVFARTSPQQKLVIVEHFQKNGEIVAVTGDGVNDSPALKQANIGVAMGIAGSDVAKEAAKVILMDDNFSSITKGVEEGRVIFENLSKSIMYTLSHLIPEVAPFIFNLCTGFPVTLTTILILFIDLGTELAPAISIAYELPESNIMKKKPRDIKKDRLVSAKNLFYAYIQIGFIETLACFTCFLFVFIRMGVPSSVVWSERDAISSGASFTCNGTTFSGDAVADMLRKAQTAYFACMVLCQSANLIACKTISLSVFQHGFRNKHVNLAIPISYAIMIFLIFVPGLNTGIGTSPPPGIFWVLPLPFMFFIVAHTEAIKFIKRRFFIDNTQDDSELNEIEHSKV